MPLSPLGLRAWRRARDFAGRSYPSVAIRDLAGRSFSSGATRGFRWAVLLVRRKIIHFSAIPRSSTGLLSKDEGKMYDFGRREPNAERFRRSARGGGDSNDLGACRLHATSQTFAGEQNLDTRPASMASPRFAYIPRCCRDVFAEKCFSASAECMQTGIAPQRPTAPCRRPALSLRAANRDRGAACPHVIFSMKPRWTGETNIA